MHNHHPHPKFSIITVTYNAAKVLEDTIQSIVTQTYKNLEYIIVDGGSTDETLDIIHKYQEHITTVISEPDQGLYDAMNKGIKLATGDYLCFLNAGDGLHEDDTLLQMVHSINGTAKKADVLHNTHLTLIDYLNEGMTTRNHKASLKERFRIMSRHYGWASTVTHHLWFVLRLLYK